MKTHSIFWLLAIIAFYSMSSCNSSNHKVENTALQPVVLSNSHNKASCVFLTSDEKNNPVISWIEMDSTGKKHFYFERWDAATNKFGERMSIPIEQNAAIHEEGMPKIAIKGDGSLFALYETSVPSKNSKWGLGDIRYVQSFDGGKSWTSPRSVAPEEIAKGLSCSFSGLTRLSDGEIGITWLGTNSHSMNMTKHSMISMDHSMNGMKHSMGEEGRPVEFAKTEGKNGISHPFLIDSNACQCCRTAVSSSKDGRIGIAYRDLLPGEIRDISFSRSDNNGNTFSAPVSFSNDDWAVDGCPHDGPSVASKKNKSYVAWFSGGKESGVHYAELDSTGRMIIKKELSPNGRFIQLCILPDGTRIAAYNETYEKGDTIFSKIIINKIEGNTFLQKVITKPNRNASYPVIQAVNNEDVIVAWKDNEKVYYELVNTATIINPIPETPLVALSSKAYTFSKAGSIK